MILTNRKKGTSKQDFILLKWVKNVIDFFTNKDKANKRKKKKKGKAKERKKRLTIEERKLLEQKQLKERNRKREFAKQRKQKITTIVEVIRDRLIPSSKLLLINVVLKVPSMEELINAFTEKGIKLSATEIIRYEKIINSNRIIDVFKDNLIALFKHEDKVSSSRVHDHNLFVAWVREFGGSNERRHYHVLIGINGRREFSLGPYRRLPSRNGNLGRRIAYCWIKALGLDIPDFTLDDGFGGSMFGWLVYYPAKKNKSTGRVDTFKRSRLIGRLLSEIDMSWLYQVISYMLKIETKEIPEEKRGVTKEKERTFGCSQRFSPI